MFASLCAAHSGDADLPARANKLILLRRVLDGTLYDVLPYSFHDERTAGGDYIPLRLRRPSVRYSLPRIVVEDSVALLFSDGHFPTLESPDHEVRAVLGAFAKETRLMQVMTEAAISGSVGTTAILLRILKGRPFLEVLDPSFLAPEWDPAAPDTLVRVTQRYKVPGRDLAAMGYELAEPSRVYWFQRVWDQQAETWFLPLAVGSGGPVMPDPSRTVRHGLGFVPIAWIRNLPGGEGPDGACTFRAAIETGIEIDYQLSQAGRGLRYSADPTLLIKEPAGIEGDIVRGAGNALLLSEKGDARLLEIGGTASSAVLDYVRLLRELALESVHGNRADASRLAAAASGRALELMSQGLVWLADNLRVAYGEGGILPLARMVLQAAATHRVVLGGAVVPALDPHAPVSLAWPRFYPQTSEDRARDAQTLTALAKAGHLSRHTVLRSLASTYDIEDLAAEQAQINAEQDQ